MIKFENRQDEYAYRVASLDLDPSVSALEEGQFVTIKAGKLVLANKDSVKSFLAIGSKRQGRDQVAGKIVQKISFLVGAAVVSVTNYDAAKVYSDDITALTALSGTLLPAEIGDVVVAYAIGKPKSGVLRIVTQA